MEAALKPGVELRHVVAAYAYDVRVEQASVGPRGEVGGATSEVYHERAVALLLCGEHRCRRACARVAHVENLELRGLGGALRVGYALRGAVYAERAQLEDVSAHTAWRRDVLNVVQTVAEAGDLKRLTFGGEGDVVHALTDRLYVLVAHRAARQRHLNDRLLRADLRTGDDEVCLCYGVVVLGDELLLHGRYRVSRLRDVHDLAFADA